MASIVLVGRAHRRAHLGRLLLRGTWLGLGSGSGSGLGLGLGLGLGSGSGSGFVSFCVAPTTVASSHASPSSLTVG
eukprot:scaffold94474_cov25-Phaeocystis_antarctica.AAC.1